MQGILLIDKPKGITSFSAVRMVKRLSGEKRVGHTGTLDPLATGVLPVFLGRATALSSFLLDADKEYIARVRLGISTDSCDITGNVINTCDVNVTEKELLNVINSFKGESLQKPPMFSALKKDGVRLYDLARQGKEVEIEPRRITISQIELSDFDGVEFNIKVKCSKGTYIRSLCRDIGEKLSCGATMTELRRIATSGFDINDCVPLDELNENNIKEHLLSEEIAVETLREIEVTEKQALRFSNGGQLDFERLKTSFPQENELLRVKFKDVFLGIGRADLEKRELAIKCVINSKKTKE